MPLEIAKKSFYQLKRDWTRLSALNRDCVPFRTYEYAGFVYAEYRMFPGLRGTPEFYLISDGDQPLMICPVVRKRGSGPRYTSFGAKLSVAHEDFIYSAQLSDDTLYECLMLLLGQLGAISFRFVSQSSRLYAIALARGLVRNESTSDAAALTLPQTYAAYYNSLSKNMRGTIRTARNRLETDALKDDLKIYFGKTVPPLLYLKASMLYATSKTAHYYAGHLFVRKAFHWLYLVLLQHNALALNHTDTSVFVVYRIDGVPTAMMGGFADAGGQRVILHRIGYNDKLSRYSPGVLMFQKMVRQLIETTDVKVLDLTIGGESYKTRWGAEAYEDLWFDLAARTAAPGDPHDDILRKDR